MEEETMIRFLRAAAVAAPALAAVALAVPAASASTTAAVTATTTFVNHSDSGNHGNWATDAFTRTATVTPQGLSSSPHCGAAWASCYRFSASVTDKGAFTTVTPGKSPQAGTTLPVTPVKGTLAGGWSGFTFYASSNAVSADGVLRYVNGDGPVSTSDWLTQFFPKGTLFSGSLVGNWSWTYKAAGTCEQWVDAYNNSGGSLPADGDITGVSQCVAPVASVLTPKDVCGPWNHRVWSVTNSAGDRVRTGWIATYVWHGRYWKRLGYLRLTLGQTRYITAREGVQLRVGFWNGLSKFVYTYAKDQNGPAC